MYCGRCRATSCSARLHLVGWTTPRGAAHVVCRGYPGSYPPQDPSSGMQRTSPPPSPMRSPRPRRPRRSPPRPPIARRRRSPRPSYAHTSAASRAHCPIDPTTPESPHGGEVTSWPLNKSAWLLLCPYCFPCFSYL